MCVLNTSREIAVSPLLYLSHTSQVKVLKSALAEKTSGAVMREEKVAKENGADGGGASVLRGG